MNIIYNDNILLTTQINEGAIERYELMKEHYVMLPFSLENPVYFPLGSYAIIDNVRFELCDLYKPDFNINTGGYDYKLRLDIYYWKWKNKIFKYLPTENSGGETEWSLTAPLAVFLEVFCRNLAKLGYTYNSQAYTYSIDNTVTTASKNIVFSSANMIDALNQMADTFGCEWWVTDNIIHFGRNENGTYTDFQIGVNVETMSRSDSKTTYATRVIAFGSTRNIPSNYRENSTGVTVEGVVQKRLMLPVSQCPSGYVDAAAGQTQEESVEAVLILDDIYPKVECVVGEVSPYQASVEEEGQTITKTFYRVDDTSGFLDNFTDEMILEGETLRILFESGLLQGMEFDCQLILDDSLLGKCFEVVVNEDYGRELPDDILFPQSGDKYVISGWDATKIAATGIIDKAEQELYQETLAYINKTKIDPNTYECTLMSDYAQEHEFAIGAKIRLLNAAYFQDGRYSRVIGYEKKLDIPYDTPKYFVGETPSVSRLGNLEAEVKSLMYGGSEYGYAGGSAYYLITSNDTTKATDDNVYSALASEKRFLRKDVQDTAKEKITFNKGLQIGPNFVPGIAGGVGGLIDKDANAQLRSLVLTSFLQVPELRYNRVLVELGDKWNAPGAGIIEEVTIDDGGTSGTCKLKLEDGEYGAISVGDICMGIFHSESTPSMNATVDSDDGKGNFQFAGFYTCYFRITSVSNAEGKVNNQYFTYSLRPTDGRGGAWNKAWHPSEGMHFVVYGSFTDTSRQTSVYTTRTYTRMLVHQNSWEFSIGNIGLQYGDMTNLTILDDNLDMSGYSIYLNNVYFTGTIRQVDSHGHEIMVANDRGAYVAGETYAYYDRVSTSEGLWLCINENGTNTAPSADNSDWLLQVPAGESLQPYGHWSSKNTPYPANSVVSFADIVWVSNKETSEPPYPAYLLSDGSYALLSDNGYALAGETESDDWDLLIDISGITSGEDGEGLEVQYSADKTNWHTTPLETDLYFRQRVGSSGAWSPAYLMVGEAGQDGDYKDFEFAVNQSTTTAPTSGWQDAPPTVPNGYYLWMRVRWVYGDGRQPSAWAVTRIKGDKGDKGDSNVLVDFTNEIIQVACDSTYKAAGAQTKTTGVNMYYGTNSCAISEITVSGTHSEWASVNSQTATITFTIPDQAIVSEITYDVAVTGTYNGQTYTRTVKLVLHGVRGGADGSPAVLYELEPSVDTIAKYKDDTLSVANISCTRIKYVGDQRSITTDGGLRYRIDDTGDEVSISNGQNIPTSRITKSITFYLYINDTLVDKERIPLITDGKDGAGFSLAGAWSSEHGTYSKMSVVTMGGASFVAKVDTANPPLWCYKLSDGSYAKTSDGGYLLTGEENTAEYDMLVQAPSAPLDSISDEFIFKNSTTKPSRPTSQNTDDYVPTGWTDDPVGVSITFPTEYVCKRTRKNGVWGEYSDPAVFAQFGKDGGFKSRVFLRSNTQPETPTGGTYDNPIPNGWSDGIPSGTAILWSSVCTFNADGTSSGWSTPAAETDTDTLDIEFSPSTTEPAAPSGSTPYADHESEGWYDPNSPNFGGKDYIWRAERKVSNGVYDGDWTITRIKGEKGDKGADGESAIIADIDNEVQSIACTSEGKATKAYTLTTTVSMWYGLTELTLSNVTWNTISGITVSRSGKILTFKIANAATIAEVNKFSLSVSATHDGKTYSKSLVFTINGVRGGADGTPATIYSLVPSATSIKRDKEGSHSPSVIYCTRQKTVGSQITNNTTDGTITYSVNNGSEQRYTNNTNITVTSSMETVAFFFRIGSALVDKETLHVIEDGKDGEGYNHRGDWVSGMTLSKNDVVNMGGGTYVARHDNVTSAPLCTYLLSNGDRIVFSDGGYALTGELNTTDYWVMVARPEDGKDGKDFEFIFKLTETEDTRPSKPTSQNTDDYVPSGWTDDATGISLAYRAEWFCMRKKENGVWGEYSDPVLWSRYAEDGEAAVFADLDNEMDAVTVDEKGMTTSPWTFTTNVSLLAGAQGMAMSAITFEAPTGVTGTADVSTGACTIAIASGTTIGDKAAVKINISGTIGDKTITRTLTFTIKGVVGGVVYRLVPMYNAISKSASGSIIPSASFPVRIQKIVNGVVSDAGRNEAVIYYSINGAGYNACQNFSTPWWQIPISNTVSMLGIQARLTGSSNTVIDEETIHTVDDGATGKGVVSAVRWYILCSSNTTLSVGTNTSGSWRTTKPTATASYKYIWAKDIYTYTDNTTTETAAFCISPEKGDPGRYGAAPRIREYDAIANLTDSESKYIYRGDEENAEWYDIVVVTNPANGSQRKFRLKAISNRPRLITNLPKPTVDDGWATYWQEAESRDFVDIDLLVARVAYLENLVASIVKAREMYLFANVQRSGDPAIEFYVSEDNGVNQGHLVFNQLDSDGNATASYDLSYEGLKNLQSSGTAVPSIWTSMNGFVQPVNSSGTYYTNLYQIWTRFYITSVDSSTHINGKTYYRYTAAGVRQQDGTVIYNGPDAVHNGKLFKSASASVGNFVADGRYVQFSGEAMIVTTDTDVEVYKGFAITVSSGTITGKVAFYYNSDGHKMVQNESGTWQQASSDTISWT